MFFGDKLKPAINARNCVKLMQCNAIVLSELLMPKKKSKYESDLLIVRVSKIV